ncbi:hypothetical protein D3C87_1232960 [compost metagenome]
MKKTFFFGFFGTLVMMTFSSPAFAALGANKCEAQVQVQLEDLGYSVDSMTTDHVGEKYSVFSILGIYDRGYGQDEVVVHNETCKIMQVCSVWSE